MKPETDRRYFKELRFRQLRAFCQAAHTGSFSAAADALGVSRPALWNQVRALESEFKTQLIRLKGRRVKLTEDGQMLFDLAAPVVEAFDGIKDIFAERHRTTPRTLAIATTASLLNYELSRPLTVFEQSHPEVGLRFMEGPSRECARRLETGEVELAVFGSLVHEPSSPRLHLTPLGRFSTVLIHAQHSPLASARRLDAKELARHKLILPTSDTNARRLLDAFFTKAGVLGRLHIAIEAQDTFQFANPSALKLGALLDTISPIQLAELQPQIQAMGLVVRELAAAGFEQIHCARRIGHSLTSAAVDFLKLVMDDTESFVRQPLNRRGKTSTRKERSLGSAVKRDSGSGKT